MGTGSLRLPAFCGTPETQSSRLSEIPPPASTESYTPRSRSPPGGLPRPYTTAGRLSGCPLGCRRDETAGWVGFHQTPHRRRCTSCHFPEPHELLHYVRPKIPRSPDGPKCRKTPQARRCLDALGPRSPQIPSSETTRRERCHPMQPALWSA